MNQIKTMSTTVAQFDQLPDAAQLRIAEVAQLLSVATQTVRRRVKADPRFPQPREFGPKTLRWQVGELRAYLTAGTAA